MATNDPRTLLPGVFPDRQAAEEAAAALKQDLGLSDREVAVVVPAPGKYYVENREEPAMFRGLVTGLLIGILIGSMAGMIVAVFAVPGTNRVSLAGALVLGGLGGAVWGAFFGGVIGLMARDHGSEDKDERYEIPAGSDQVLVIVTAEDVLNRARTIMRQHGALCFLEHTLDVTTPSVEPTPAEPLVAPAAG
jgi:hypothetical protein